VSQTLDGMSVTELEALKARVEATLKEQREKAENPGWDIEPGHVKQVNGWWRGVALDRLGRKVPFRVLYGEVQYTYHGEQGFVGYESRWLDGDTGLLDTPTACRVVAQLALKALGQ
jgi:hypothetical protein